MSRIAVSALMVLVLALAACASPGGSDGVGDSAIERQHDYEVSDRDRRQRMYNASRGP
jgi:hypothetical protein